MMHIVIEFNVSKPPDWYQSVLHQVKDAIGPVLREHNVVAKITIGAGEETIEYAG